MKITKLLMMFMLVLSIVFFNTCEEDNSQETNPPNANAFPDKFKVEIPAAISKTSSKAKTSAEQIHGNSIYEHLTTFVGIGEAAADLVEEIMIAIGEHNLNQPLDITYTGNEDGREKHLIVTEDVTFEHKQWAFQLTVTDLESESNADGGKAMQVFWNGVPVDGIAILKPYNINREDETLQQNTMFRIDYSETGTAGYDAAMTVYIANHPMPDAAIDPYGVNHIKMFAGKKDNYVDVYGNSNHPNALFYTDNTGFNWAFAASSDENQNIAVAEVGLPANTLNASDRVTLLEEHSIYDVFYNQIQNEYPNIDSATIQEYLTNTKAPGYFDNNGFTACETPPNENYNEIEIRMKELVPYNPSKINNLTIDFRQ